MNDINSTKILVDARLGWGSGIGRYIRNAVPMVAERMPEHRFDLLVGPDDADTARRITADIANIKVLVSPLAAFSMGEQLGFNKVARGYDLVWFTNYWVPLSFRGRFIATVHDMIHLERKLFDASPVKRALSWATFRHVSRRAEGISFGSRFSQREFERRFSPVPHTIILHYGIDHAGWSLFDPDDPPAKKPKMLIVAAAKKHKNFRIAIDAFGRADLPPHWGLTIITPNDKLRSSIDLEGLANSAKVEFRQGLTNDELRSLYAETAVVLMPSRYEGFGLPLLEGLQAGAQCISSTAPSLVEIGGGADVYFVNPDDPAGWMKAIEQEAARFDAGAVSPETTRANMRHAMQYVWDKTADSTVGLLKRVLGGS